MVRFVFLNSEIAIGMGKEGEAKAEASEATQLPQDWVDEHADVLYRFALRRISDQHVVEDLLQETFLAAYKAQETFRGESSVRTWLIAILRLKIIDHFRRSSRDASQYNPEHDESGGQFRAEALSAWTNEAAKVFEKQEFWEVLRKCSDKLPATLARAFFLREVDGCDPATVCELLQISRSNLSVRVYRARALMRDCLDSNWFS